MKDVNYAKLKTLGLMVIVFAAALTAPLASAQDADGSYVRYFITTVHHDSIAEFEDLLKERAAGLRAGGRQSFRSVYESVHGEQYRYLMVDSVPSLAALDRPPVPAAAPTALWAQRMDAVQSAQRVVILRIYPELNVPTAQGAVRNLVRMRIRRTTPSRTSDYYDWQANQLIPALREAGITGRVAGRVVLGGSVNTWISISDEPNFASMATNPLAESMGERQSAQMLARGDAILVHSEDLVMRFRPDLGFVNPNAQN